LLDSLLQEMNTHNNNPHPTVQNLRIIHGARTRRQQSYYHSSHVPPSPPQKEWKPKNPQVTWPNMKQEEPLTQSQWSINNFPSCPPLSSVTGVVNIPAWYAKIWGSEQVNKGLVDLMLKVRHQLSEGADSHVGSPDTTLTQGTNWISEEVRADNAYTRVTNLLQVSPGQDT